MHDAVVALDAAGNEIVHNSAYERLRKNDVIMEDDQAPGTPAVGQLLDRAGRGESFTIQLRAVDGEGNRRWFEALSQPVQRNGRAEGGILVIRDITERSLRRLQEEFVAIVAHELRTPLTALQGYLQLLVEDSPAGEHYADLALEQLDRMREMIGDLFDTARIQSGTLSFEYEDVALDRLVRDTVDVASMLSGDRRIDATVRGTNLRVRADPRRFQQVLLNVLTNAMTHGGDGQITVRAARDQGEAVIEIADHGPGVPEQDLPTLFDRFGQTRAGQRRRTGLGLGLFISRQIVVAHGGTIDAESKPGEGLVVRIRMPLLGLAAVGPLPDAEVRQVASAGAARERASAGVAPGPVSASGAVSEPASASGSLDVSNGAAPPGPRPKRRHGPGRRSRAG